MKYFDVITMFLFIHQSFRVLNPFMVSLLLWYEYDVICVYRNITLFNSLQSTRTWWTLAVKFATIRAPLNINY
jgi:hypothetical protein